MNFAEFGSKIAKYGKIFVSTYISILVYLNLMAKYDKYIVLQISKSSYSVIHKTV